MEIFLKMEIFQIIFWKHSKFAIFDILRRHLERSREVLHSIVQSGLDCARPDREKHGERINLKTIY